MDIGSGKEGPAGKLSNFPPSPFMFDGVLCNSVEGPLQAFKHKNPEMQVHVCSLVGRAAKFKGKKKKWWRDQKLYWQGNEYDRHSPEYQQLLDRLFQAVFDQNESKRNALLATGNAVLRHSMGKNDPSKTVLTEQEFCSRLMKNRSRLQALKRP